MLEDTTVQFTIRPWCPEDREAILSLHKELQAYEIPLRTSRSAKDGVSAEYIKELEEQLHDSNCDSAFFVAEMQEEVVGFVFCAAEEDLLDEPAEQIYVQDIMVTENYRGLGIGKSLMKAVFVFAEERNISRINLMVLANNEKAVSFYNKLGFQTAILHLEHHMSG